MLCAMNKLSLIQEEGEEEEEVEEEEEEEEIETPNTPETHGGMRRRGNVSADNDGNTGMSDPPPPHPPP